jgi:hypothetical protein
MPREHRSRDDRPLRNRLPDGGSYRCRAVRVDGDVTGRHGWCGCRRRDAHGRLSGMGSSRTSVRATRHRIAAILATLVRIVGGLAVLILVAHIVLTLGDANPANVITKLVASWADRLQIGFRGLFTPADARTGVIVNYGLAAAFWLIVTWIVVRLLQRLS